uniref:GG12242 n=1 Tax=Drosophila erecta TaxID=7220 RepID=B3P6I6_DROER
MIARIAFYILPVLIIGGLVEIEGLPSAGDVQDSRKILLDQDDLFISCCRSLRKSDPSDNCQSCEDQFRSMEPVTEASQSTQVRNILGVQCVKTHIGCQQSHKINSADTDNGKKELPI